MSKRSAARNKRQPKGVSLTVGPKAAGLLAVGLLVVAGALWIGSGLGRQSTGTGSPTAAEPMATPFGAEVTADVSSSPPGFGVTVDGDPFIGSAAAPVTVVEYSDYQCPNCRQFATEVLPWLADTWLGRGFVRVVYRDFAIRGDASFRAAEAAHCAGDQDRYWEYHDALFEAAGAPFDPSQLKSLAAGLQLDGTAFAACLESGRHRGRVKASTDAAHARGFEGTPTYEINGRVTAGAIPIDRWNELFQAYETELGG